MRTNNCDSQLRGVNPQIYGFRRKLMLVLGFPIFLSLGCQLVNNSVNGNYDSGIADPIVQEPVPESISLKLGQCVASLPEAIPYTCDLDPEIVYTQGVNSATNIANHNLTPLDSHISYELINNGCPGLVITSTGVLEGQIAKTNTETCTATIRATFGQLVTEKDITLSITPSLTLSFDQTSVLIEAGVSQASVNLILSAPLAFTTYVDFEVYGNNQAVLSGISLLTRRILIPKGQTVVNINLSVASSVGIAATVYQAIQLKNGSANDLPKYNVVTYPEAQIFPNFSQLVAGYDHMCGIAAGELYCWGKNLNGRVGTGDAPSVQVPSPKKIGSLTNWVAISANIATTCGIAGTMIYCWGSGTYGRLGNGTTTGDVLTPAPVGGPVINWSQVSAGRYTTIALDNLGQLYSWGSESSGALGNGPGLTLVTTPTLVGSPSNYIAISNGEFHACAITTGNDLECWGSDTDGQLGNGGITGSIESPTIIDASGTWTSIATGSQNTCGIDNGFLRCWGFNDYGTVGDTSGSGDVLTPQQIGLSSNWKSVSIGRFHACGINDTTGANNNNVFCWGRGTGGQLGFGLDFLVNEATPKQVSGTGTWQSVASGEFQSCATDNNKLYCWGGSSSANGISASGIAIPLPTQVGSSTTWTNISSGYSHSCGIDQGRLYCWGQNDYGEIGLGNTTQVRIYNPTLVGNSTKWTQISAGRSFTCGLQGGELYCWGSDEFEKNGNGASTGTVSSPERIGSSTGWQSISLGDHHACGINGGQLYCWGGDDNGKQGNNALTGDVDGPTLINASTSWTSVSAGALHTCGIDAGDLYCWGSNNTDQLGSGGGASDVIVPSIIDNNGIWTTVVAGLNFSCGLRAGQIFCWGGDDRGQAGNGAGQTGNVPTPELVAGYSDWQKLAPGTTLGHVCAIRNEQIYCWGGSDFYQTGLGLSGSVDQTSPAVTEASSAWQSIAVGRHNTCGLTEGQLFCWGSNQYSQSAQQIIETTIPNLITDY